MKHSVRWAAVLTLGLLLLFVPSSAREAVGEEAAELLTLPGAVDRAMAEGDRGQRARLEMTEALLEAADLQRQHEIGPPRGQTMTFPGPNDEPVRITIGAPTDLEKAEVEELLPLQFAAVRQVARARYSAQMAALRAEVIELYFGVLLAEMTVDLHRDSLQRLEAHQESAELLHERGRVAKIDVIRARAEVSGGEADLRAAGRARDRALLALRDTLGMDFDAQLALADPPDASVSGELDLAADVQLAIEVSPEVQSAEAQVKLAHKEEQLFREHRGGYTRRRSYMARSLAIDRAEQTLGSTERVVERQVRELYSHLAEMDEKREALADQVELAARAAEVATVQYEAGLTTVTDVLDSGVRLREAELAQREAEVGHMIALAQRDALLGAGVADLDVEYDRIRAEIDELR